MQSPLLALAEWSGLLSEETDTATVLLREETEHPAESAPEPKLQPQPEPEPEPEPNPVPEPTVNRINELKSGQLKVVLRSLELNAKGSTADLRARLLQAAASDTTVAASLALVKPVSLPEQREPDAETEPDLGREPEPQPEPEPVAERPPVLEPLAEPEPEPEPKDDAATPVSSASKIYVERVRERSISLAAGERCEFAVAVRDGLTIDVSATFRPCAAGGGDDAAVEVLPLQRAVTVQGSYETPEGVTGSLRIELSNEFSWVTNKLIVLSVTKSTAEQRQKVEAEHAAIVAAQQQRQTAEEQRRASEAATQLKEAREFLRFEELLQETLEACPENCPDKAEVVKALKQVGVKILPPVHAAQETVAKETRSSSPGNG